MKSLPLATALLFTLAACSGKKDVSERIFHAAIDADLSKDGKLCLVQETWPVDVTEVSRKLGASFGVPSEAVRMDALVAAGLATSARVEVPSMSSLGQGTGLSVAVTRHVLTDEGRKYFVEHTSASGKAKDGRTTGALCYGMLAIDKVVKWEGPMKLGDYQEALVKYHYKIVGLTDWARNPEIQSAFPAVKQWVDGAGSKLLSRTVHLTSEGWETKGMDR